MFLAFRLPQVSVATLILLVVVVPATAVQRKPAAVHNLSLESVNTAEGRRGKLSPNLLAHASPGEIDANRGENTRKAVVAFREMRNLGSGEQVDERYGVHSPTRTANPPWSPIPSRRRTSRVRSLTRYRRIIAKKPP